MKIEAEPAIASDNADQIIDGRPAPLRYRIEQFFLVVVTILPLVGAIWYRLNDSILSIAALPVAFLICCIPEVRAMLKTSWAVGIRHFSTRAAVALALWVITASFFGAFPRPALMGAATAAVSIIMVFIVAATLRTIPRDRIFPPLIFFTALAGLVAIISALTGGALQRLLGCRGGCQEELQAHMSGAAMTIVLFVWPCAGWLAAKGKRSLFIAIIAVGVSVVAVSRSGTAALGFSAALLAFGLAQIRPRAIAFLPLVLASLSFLAVPYLITLTRSLNDVGFSKLLARFHANERAQIWSFYTDLFWQRPWIGYGFGAEGIIGNPTHMPSLNPPPLAFWHPHNLPLQILFEFGVVGAVLTFAVLAAIACRLYANRASGVPFLIATVITFMAATLVNFGVWEWWFLNAVSLSLVFSDRLLHGDAGYEGASQATSSPHR